MPLPSAPSARAKRSRRFGPIVFVGVLLAVALVVPLAILLGRGDGRRAPERGDRAPGFEVPTLDGGMVALSDLRGQPVVLHFCGSWNPQCDEELRLLVEAQAREAGAVVFLEVPVQDDPDAARAYYRRHGVTWTALLDPDGAVARAYGVRAVPQSFFIGGDGVVVARSFGALAPPTLEGHLRNLGRSATPTTPSGT